MADSKVRGLACHNNVYGTEAGRKFSAYLTSFQKRPFFGQETLHEQGGFHKINRLSEERIDCSYGLGVVRMCRVAAILSFYTPLKFFIPVIV